MSDLSTSSKDFECLWGRTRPMRKLPNKVIKGTYYREESFLLLPNMNVLAN